MADVVNGYIAEIRDHPFALRINDRWWEVDEDFATYATLAFATPGSYVYDGVVQPDGRICVRSIRDAVATRPAGGL